MKRTKFTHFLKKQLDEDSRNLSLVRSQMPSNNYWNLFVAETW